MLKCALVGSSGVKAQCGNGEVQEQVEVAFQEGGNVALSIRDACSAPSIGFGRLINAYHLL